MKSFDHNSLYVYLASPLFTPSQNATLDKVEKMLSDAGILFFSPRQSGVDISKLEGQARLDAAQFIYDSNVEFIKQCNVMLANIDDRDVGTAFEIGKWTERDTDNTALITYSGNGYGLNIMLNNCGMVGHFSDVDHLRSVFSLGEPITNVSQLKMLVRGSPHNTKLQHNVNVEKS